MSAGGDMMKVGCAGCLLWPVLVLVVIFGLGLLGHLLSMLGLA